MNWRQLAEQISMWPEELQECEVIIKKTDFDEFSPARLQFAEKELEELDENHPYLESKEIY